MPPHGAQTASWMASGALQRDKEATRKALRASASGTLGTRFLPEPVARHIEDIAAIVFRRKPKQLIPLREVSPFARFTAQPKPQPPRQPLGPDGKTKLTF